MKKKYSGSNVDVRSVDLYKLMCVQGVQSREVLQLVLQRTPIFKQLILQISTNTLNLPLSILPFKLPI